ncbi:MAG: AAA family ATPase [Thermodesulfobacteriota bacterium]|nr:AAA family ATPase [Thermodesulfobacteriota bacterium]
MMLNRNIEEKIRRGLKYFPVVILTGARQSGKTTLAKTICPEWSYFDLENGTDFDRMTSDFDFFFKQHPESVIIDEAQSAPQLFQELRGIVDASREKKGRFVLTGSSSPELLHNISESLAGRVSIVEVGTLKMNERYQLPLSSVYTILNESSAHTHLDKFGKMRPQLNTEQVLSHFLKGGYPEPVVEASEEFFSEWMVNYQQTYIERDIRRLFPRLNTQNFRRFIRMLSEMSGTIVNRSEVGRSLNISESAVRDYLDIAQGTFVWRTLPSLERTVSKSVVKMSRGYFRDSGLLHHLLNVREIEQIYTRPATGSAFEGFIIEEIILGLRAVETAPWDFAFYRTRGGAEVDLILTSPTGIRIPIEIKFGVSVRRAQLKSLTEFIEREQCPYGIVVNNGDRVQLLADNIVQIPAGLL